MVNSVSVSLLEGFYLAFQRIIISYECVILRLFYQHVLIVLPSVICSVILRSYIKGN